MCRGRVGGGWWAGGGGGWVVVGGGGKRGLGVGGVREGGMDVAEALWALRGLFRVGDQSYQYFGILETALLVFCVWLCVSFYGLYQFLYLSLEC